MKHLRPLFFLVCCLLLSGCVSLNGARPLEPGKHELAATFGGGTVIFGGSPVPLPNLIVEGRSGIAKPLDRPLDINYGLNLTPLAFGIIQLHVGTSWLLVKPEGAIPAVSMTNRLWFATNFPAAGARIQDVPGTIGAWGTHQLEFNMSWEIKNQLLYVALAQYTDFTNPTLTLTPAIGAMFDFGQPGGFKLGVELRWYAINQTQAAYPFTFFPNTQGTLGLSLGFSYAF